MMWWCLNACGLNKLHGRALVPTCSRFINLVECEILWIDGWDFSNNETSCDLEVNTSEEGKIERDDACLLTRLSYFLSVGNLLLPPLSSPLSLLLLVMMMMMMSVALSPDLHSSIIIGFCSHHLIFMSATHYEMNMYWSKINWALISFYCYITLHVYLHTTQTGCDSHILFGIYCTISYCWNAWGIFGLRWQNPKRQIFIFFKKKKLIFIKLKHVLFTLCFYAFIYNFFNHLVGINWILKIWIPPPPILFLFLINF